MLCLNLEKPTKLTISTYSRWSVFEILRPPEIGIKAIGDYQSSTAISEMQKYLYIVVAIVVGLEPVSCCLGGLSGGKNPDGSMDDCEFEGI